MSSVRRSRRWPTAATGSTLLLILASKAIAVYGATFIISNGDKIQDALNEVIAGDTIEIESGEYYEDLQTRVDGTADERITIRGAGGWANRENVVLRGAGKSRVLEINHDYYTIEGFTINGENLNVEATQENFKTAIRDKPIYVIGDREPTMRNGGYASAIDGLIIRQMVIKNSGGECIRLRYFVTNAEISGNNLESCGLYDYKFNDGGENGEGIYIGTATNQWDEKNPTDEPDMCMGNLIHNNIINTKGNEGVEVKEGSVDNTIENNWIYMQKDPDSGGIASRGDGTIIRYNHIEDAAGAGVRLGGHVVRDRQYGVDNQVYGNTMVDCMSYGVKVMAWPQGNVCGNDISLPDDEDEDTYEYRGGTYGDNIEPREVCDFDPTTPPPSPTPSPLTPAPLTPSPTSSSSTATPATLTPASSSPTPAPSTPAPTPSPSTRSPTQGPSTATPAPSTTTPAPSTSAPSPAPSTPLPTPAPPTATPTRAPSTPVPTPAPSTTTPVPSVSTPGPSTTTPAPSTPGPTPAPSTPSPTPALSTPTPSPSTPAPTPAPPTPPPTPAPSTAKPTLFTPTPTIFTATPSPTPAPSTPTPAPSTATPVPSTPTPAPSTPTPAPSTLTPAPSTPTPAPPTPTPARTPFTPTPAPADSAEAEIKLLGCFADSSDSRTMGFGYQDVDGMTNEDCIDYCRSEGKSFAGTSRGISCRCTNSSTGISRNGESTECTTACAGDPSTECGGSLAVSTWQI